VTANAYFLPTKRRIKDTFISSENAPKLTAIRVLENFPGVNPRTPITGRGKGRGGRRVRGWAMGLREKG
jgi:hypothetical protein